MSDTTPALFGGDSGQRRVTPEQLQGVLPLGYGLRDLDRWLAKVARDYAETHPGFRIMVEWDPLTGDHVFTWRTKR